MERRIVGMAVIELACEYKTKPNPKEVAPDMSTIMPEGENIQKAIKWISSNIEESGSQPLHMLIEKAVFKFDLSPKDTEFLMGFFRNRKNA
jgi:hypothetical protein